MRLFLVVLVQAILVQTLASSQSASADDQGDNWRRSIGNIRPDSHSSPRASQPRHGEGYRHGHGHRRPGPGWGMPGWQPYYYPYGTYRYWYHPYPPPLYIPAERLYGLEPVKRLMGVDRLRPPPVIPHVITIERKADDPKPVRRAANQRSLNLGWRFIGFGDAHFANQKYADAYQRYRKAAQAAPTLADALFRQGYVLIALGRYEQAGKAMKQGLKIDPAWPRSDFRNDDLYAENRPAKAAHLDALAQAATNEPNDADLLFLVGVFLHFDGQMDRAKPFFQRAARLAGADDAHLKGFLGPVELERKVL